MAERGGHGAPEAYRLMRVFAPLGFMVRDSEGNMSYVPPSDITTTQLRALREQSLSIVSNVEEETPVSANLPQISEPTLELQSGD